MRHLTLSIATLCFVASSFVTIRADGIEIQGHAGKVTAVAFSQDGKTIASAGEDKIICIWDVATGKKLQTLTGFIDEVVSLGFSADGTKIVTGSADGTVQIKSLLPPTVVGTVTPQTPAGRTPTPAPGQTPPNSLAEQQAQIMEFIKPGVRYDGWGKSTYRSDQPRTAKMTFVFGEYEGPDQSAISGIYYLTDVPQCPHEFQLQLKPDKVERLPIQGRRKEWSTESRNEYNKLRGVIQNDAYEFVRDTGTMRLGIVDGKLIGSYDKVELDLGTPKSSQ